MMNLFCGYVADAHSAKADNARAIANLVGELQKLLSAEVAAHPSLPGELLLVSAPKQGLDISLAAGFFDRESKRLLDSHHLFRVASVTKTFTAALILRLSEEGRIKLNDPINRYLPKEYSVILEAGGYQPNAITVRHLLTHTSGIHDYATDPQYYAAALGSPKHRWARMEQVESAIKWSKSRTLHRGKATTILTRATFCSVK